MKVDSSMVDVSNGSAGWLLRSAGSMLGTGGSDGSSLPVDIDAGEGVSACWSSLAKARHVCTVSCQ